MHLRVILKGGRPPRYTAKFGGIDAFSDNKAKEGLPLAEVLR
jgi:hypothetical protein